ncbi:MAG: hypothetical protein GH151_15195 [Bacteroidetes bacterium]|nr:hypothetical protein [Bacteroidota bacterium]
MFYKSFHVTGEANKTVFDDGLTSTIDEPKRIRAIIISVTTYNNNTIEAWIETNRILQIPDVCCATHDYLVAASYFRPTDKMFRIPIDEDIKPGIAFKIAINCGAVTTSIDGSYEYEHIS